MCPICRFIGIMLILSGQVLAEPESTYGVARMSYFKNLEPEEMKSVLHAEVTVSRLRRSENAKTAQVWASDVDADAIQLNSILLGLDKEEKEEKKKPPSSQVDETLRELRDFREAIVRLRDSLLTVYESKSEVQEFRSGRWGIAPGIMYLQGVATKSYISGAYVDLAGYVRVKEDLKIVTRVFPTFTGFVRPQGASKPFYAGLTLGVNEGKVSDHGGFALAMGTSLGFIFDNNVHFGVFLGQMVDPTVQRLPNFIFKNGPLPPSANGATPVSPSLATGYQIPTESVVGRYGAYGIVLSFSF